MKTDLIPHHSIPEWTADDFAISAALKDAVDVPDAPAGLYKKPRYARAASALAGSALTLALGVWGFYTWIYPPELVREALIHEHREATLRGDFQKNKLPMLIAMGLKDGASLPGLLQLQRPCEIAGRTAYHLTTFIEKGGGIVTILAFADPVVLPYSGSAPTGQGGWLGRHWRFVEGNPGKTILLLADNPKVLRETERLLKIS